jgi:hypothetical protein
VGKKANRPCGSAKYALHSDTASSAVAFRKAGNHSTNHQCGAHVLRCVDLLFSLGGPVFPDSLPGLRYRAMGGRCGQTLGCGCR